MSNRMGELCASAYLKEINPIILLIILLHPWFNKLFCLIECLILHQIERQDFVSLVLIFIHVNCDFSLEQARPLLEEFAINELIDP